MVEQPIITINNFNLHIGKSHILKNLSFEIPSKKITVLLGPSGCGKTTLLRSMNRLIDLNKDIRHSGTILLDGENIFQESQNVSLIRKKIGLLSQNPTPLPMSIFNNVAYGLKIHGIKKKETLKELVEQNLIHVGLWEEVKDRLSEPASRLSIGQQQRLCLARGIAINPEIILADEPCSALDPISAKNIEEQFIRLKNDYTIIMVTHIMRQAKRVADYIVFMYMGEVIEHNNADEFFNNPQQEMTKEYLKGVFN
jgi:phosphate transport system ATP-binding protein